MGPCLEGITFFGDNLLFCGFIDVCLLAAGIVFFCVGLHLVVGTGLSEWDMAS